MLKAYNYCLLPTPEQKEQLAQMFGSCRFVFNLGLETKVTAYKQYGVRLNCFDLTNQIVDLKKEATWLSDCPAQALQMSLRNLDNAYTAFFRGAGFPKFKSKRGRQSFQLPQGVKADFENGNVFLPKLKWVDCIFSRAFTGAIKTVTVSRNPSGKHFVSFLVETGEVKPEKKPVTRDTAVGIDLGIKTVAMLSDARNGVPQVVENHKFLRRSLKRLRVEQRTLSRRFKKGTSEQSKNWHKQRIVVAKLHETITNQRRDFLHKASTQIINEYDTVCLENLNTSGMMKNRSLALAIGEVGWNEFNQMLEYKADWQGKHILRIGRFEPSSRICNVCGYHNKELKLSDRVWTCANGHSVERDQNAALNIKDFGLRVQPLSVKTGR